MNRMFLKNERKIRKMLGKNYHLSVSSDGKWSLFRKYDDWDKYISPNNKAIMTSKTNTEDELLKFAEDHKRYDESKIRCIVRSLILFVAVILSFMNCWLSSELIFGIVWGINISIIIINVAELIVAEHNFKITKKEFNRDLGYREDFDFMNKFQLKTIVKYEGKKYLVSTVDLGINYNFMKEGEPIYYETMVFLIDKDTKQSKGSFMQVRYSTEKQAKKGHKFMVRLIKNGEVSDLKNE